MIASVTRILIILLVPTVMFGQSLDLSISSATSNNGPSTFLLEEGEISINAQSLRFLRSGKTVNDYKALGISPDYSIVSLLKYSAGDSRILLFNSTGDSLNSYAGISIGADDPSLAVYPFNNGSVLLRDNITNFTFFDTFGDISTNMSSSSGSEQGEAISEVAMSPDGKTIVVYNPKIKRKGLLGSKAQVMMSDGSFKNIYFNTKRYLKDVNISNDGNLVVAITAREGTEDRVIVMDKYGNELNTFTTGENLVGASLTDDTEHIALYSGGRVIVYTTLGGERLGATSFRTPVFLADYFHEDNVILALTGNFSKSTGTLSGIEFRAINLEQREIASQEMSGEIGFNNSLTPQIVRTSADTYQLVGASKKVTIEAVF